MIAPNNRLTWVKTHRSETYEMQSHFSSMPDASTDSSPLELEFLPRVFRLSS